MVRQTILITGVSSGIGAALAKHYLDEGHQVLGLSRRAPEALQADSRFRFQSVDLANQGLIDPAIEQLTADSKVIHLAVLNAGILGTIGDMVETPLADLQQIMNVNVWANKTLIDSLFKHCDVRQIVTISSGAAVNGNRGWNGYSISKAALNMMTMLYAAENPNTHFTALAPGLVDTSMQEYLCSQPADERFASLDVIKSKRNTDEMPTPQNLAPRLANIMANLPDSIISGEFVDLRKLPETVGKAADQVAEDNSDSEAVPAR